MYLRGVEGGAAGGGLLEVTVVPLAVYDTLGYGEDALLVLCWELGEFLLPGGGADLEEGGEASRRRPSMVAAPAVLEAEASGMTALRCVFCCSL